jgi:CDP-diacylglycerol--serine O-phosphatidyltransferase
LKQYIPSIITSGNLICGFSAILIADFYWSPILLLMSFLFDSIDGLSARILNVQSDFGKQMDSLADVVSFGVAPAFLYSLYSPNPEDTLFTLSTCSLIVIAGTIRLAKFNISPSLPYFMGLPIPANALFYIGVIIAIENESEPFIQFFSAPLYYFITPLALSLMMVSFKVHMFSTKSLSPKWSENYFHLILAALSILFIFLFTYEAVSLIVIAYIILSLLYTFSSRHEKAEMNAHS